MIRTYNGLSDTLNYDFSYECGGQSFQFQLPVLNKLGKHFIRIIIDPNKVLGDADYSNNEIEFVIDVRSRASLFLEPLSYWNVDVNSPRFRFVNPKFDTLNYKDEYKILDNSAEIYSSKLSDIKITPEYIDFTPNGINLNIGKNYLLKAIRKNNFIANDTMSAILPFYADTAKITAMAKWKTNEENLLGATLEDLKFEANRITIKNKPIPFEMASCAGGFRDGKERGRPYIDMYYNNKKLLTSNFRPGITLFIIDKNSGALIDRYFRTDLNGVESDSISISFVKFLKDSVASDKYVMMSVCGYSFKMFADNPDTNALNSLKTLKDLLKSYGARKVDSLIGYSSYAFAGFKGAKPEEAFENLSVSGDTIWLSGALDLTNYSGRYTTNEIGPAQNWKSIEINYGEAKDSIIATIIGIDKNGKDQILKSATSKKIDISDINANIYPNIKINLDLFRDSLLNSANIYSIACDFEPSAEFAIIKSSTF